MTSYPTLDLKSLAAGHDGPPIPESLLTYFTERARWRLFEFLLDRFEQEEARGLTQAKLARRIGKSYEVINRWLSGPGNLTTDSAALLLLGICNEEPVFDGVNVLNRMPRNYIHLDSDAATSSRDTKEDKIEDISSTGGRSVSLQLVPAA